MSDPDYNIQIIGAGRGSNVGTSNVAGVVHGGMGNRETTNYNQGSRRIVNTGQIGNIATGDNHAGGMQATIAGQQEAPVRKDPSTLTPGELINLLKERYCTDDTIKKFETHRVDGRLFMQLARDDGILDDLGIDHRIERRKVFTLMEDLKK